MESLNQAEFSSLCFYASQQGDSNEHLPQLEIASPTTSAPPCKLGTVALVGRSTSDLDSMLAQWIEQEANVRKIKQNHSELQDHSKSDNSTFDPIRLVRQSASPKRFICSKADSKVIREKSI